MSAIADPLRFGVSTEVQSFYLNPKSSSSLFTKYEFKTFGQYDLTKHLRFKTDLTVNYVQLNPKQDRKQWVLNPNEFGFVGSNKAFDYELGFWTLVPEGTDINNIFDVIHGKDFRQPFASENLSSLGLLIKSHALNFDYSLFYIPKNRKSILPDTQSPWWPRTESFPIQSSSSTLYLPDDISYVYRNETDAKNPFDSNYGATGKLSFNWIDFHLFYYSGANQIPQIYPHFDIQAISANPPVGVIISPVDIDLNWIRSEHIGAGFSSTLDPVIVKSFCKQQKDFYQDGTTESVSCTAAIESGVAIYKSTLHYFLQVNRLWRKNDVSAELETLLGFFDKSTALGFLVDVGPESILSGAVIYNEKSPSVLSSIRYEKNWTDRFKTSFAINVISVNDQPLTKSYDSTDNASLKLSYNF